uniref:Neuroguidin n=1 Tax=Syphacia muris TaxID=451379 RepID=A0A0N5AVF2_9BILA
MADDTDALSADSVKFKAVVADCRNSVSELLKCAKELLANIRDNSERNGISLLELKNHDLLAYACELALLMCHMNCGKSIEGADAIERSVYLRTVLERIRPLEQKMRSQVERLTAIGAGSSEAAVKHLQPHPERMNFNLAGDDEEVEDDTENKDVAVKKYVPPKLVAVHYNEDEEEKEARRIERNRRRALQSSLIQELRTEYSDAPLEVSEDRRNRKLVQQEKEKEKYEEDYFVRLQVSKKERHKEKLKNRQNLIEDLLHFGDYMAMDERTTRKQKSTKSSRKRPSKPGKKKSNKRTRH